jgi:hypothetical protein
MPISDNGFGSALLDSSSSKAGRRRAALVVPQIHRPAPQETPWTRTTRDPFSLERPWRRSSWQDCSASALRPLQPTFRNWTSSRHRVPNARATRTRASRLGKAPSRRCQDGSGASCAATTGDTRTRSRCSRIDATNADKYADKLSAGQLAMLKQIKGYRMDVYPTRRSLRRPRLRRPNTKASVGTAKLADDGWGLKEATVPGYPVSDAGQRHRGDVEREDALPRRRHRLQERRGLGLAAQAAAPSGSAPARRRPHALGRQGFDPAVRCRRSSTTPTSPTARRPRWPGRRCRSRSS